MKISTFSILCCGMIYGKLIGQPSEGIIVDLRLKTRSEYYKLCKMVMRQEEEIKSDKMAFLNIHTDSFWREARQICP